MNKAEEKANELIEKYYKLFSIGLENTVSEYEATHCAIICVDNIIDELYEFDGTDGYRGNRIDLYLSVRIILENKLK